ncbi:MAG: glutamate--tRNA ligase [Candidatus Saccharimonadales bacterium]
MKVVTRFAPSPTGLLHVGGVRTALFAWLLAKQNNGTFILRLEDTDKNREVTDSDQHIIESLKWLEINWDEGPDCGGPHGPYRQSERLALYKEWADKLVSQNDAYADPYSVEEVNSFREDAKARKKPFLFRDYRPTVFPSWDGTQPLRLKSTPIKHTWHDEVMGELSAGPEAVDDVILMKSDGYPTYNFAHIIDDHLMGITHVIRSQEYVSSIPKYLNIYDVLNIPQPKFATLPFVMGPDGRKKLSKRDGAKGILDYARDGYLPEALLNFLATLGWNDGTNQEIFSINELIQKFSLAKVQKSGARFDEQRLMWLNGSHIRHLPLDTLYNKSLKFWPTSSDAYDENYKKRVLSAIQDRLKYFAEIPQLTAFFFSDLPYDLTLITTNKHLKKLSLTNIKDLLQTSYDALKNSTFTNENLTEILNQLLIDTDTKPGILFSLIRISTTQAPASPALADTMEILGKDRCLSRMETTLKKLAE